MRRKMVYYAHSSTSVPRSPFALTIVTLSVARVGMSHLELRLLGTFQALLDGLPVTGFESGKVRALLAYLAVESDGPHMRDELAALLWPDQPDQTARTNLRQALANLRQAIGDQRAAPPFLVVTRDLVQFNRESDYGLDVTSFTHQLDDCARHAHRYADRCRTCCARMEQAVALYRGDLLLGLNVTDSAPFEEWATLRRESLHQRALDALTRLAASHERRGEYERARRCAARQLELDPWREEAHQQTMRLLARIGQRSAALDQYERCRRVLADELGVEPASETTRLYEHIRDGVPPDVQPARPRIALPVPSTPLIGRERELAELGGTLENPACRLVTIVGPGGIGKTRLALAAATDQAHAFDDGAAFVSLASLTTSEFLASAIMVALNVPLQGQRDPQEQLLAYLRQKELLLVLDNLEHLPEADESVSEIIRHAPGVTLLVTSRERLKLQSEWLFDLGELQYPRGEPAGTADVEGYSAVELFTQCARRAQRRFTLGASEARAAARICQLVQGMPLAIELAATAIQQRSCEAVAVEIESGLRALASEWRDAPERHQSVWAAFEHSWRLLSAEEQRVFRQSSVFRGGFREEAAVQVSDASSHLLSALVDKSLLRLDAAGRYDMHELARQYAHEKLCEAGEIEDAQWRHALFFAEMAKSERPRLQGPEQIAWSRRFELEHDNLRSALGWAQDRGDVQVCLSLAASLAWFWEWYGYLREGRQWLEAALTAAASHPVPDHLRAKALYGAGTLAFRQSDFALAAQCLEQCLTLWRVLGDQQGVADAVLYLGNIALTMGNFEHAAVRFEESVTLFRELGDRWGEALSLGNLGFVALFQRDLAKSRALFEESLALLREIGDRFFSGSVLLGIGYSLLLQGENERAGAIAYDAFHLVSETGDKLFLNYGIVLMASVAVSQRRADHAARLLGASAMLSDMSGAPLPPIVQTMAEQVEASAKIQLDPTVFATAQAEGRAMTLEQAIELALSDKPDASKTYESRVPVAEDLDRQATAKTRQ